MAQTSGRQGTIGSLGADTRTNPTGRNILKVRLYFCSAGLWAYMWTALRANWRLSMPIGASPMYMYPIAYRLLLQVPLHRCYESFVPFRCSDQNISTLECKYAIQTIKMRGNQFSFWSLMIRTCNTNDGRSKIVSPST